MDKLKKAITLYIANRAFSGLRKFRAIYKHRQTRKFIAFFCPTCHILNVNYKNMKRLLISLFVIIGYVIAVACKSAILGPEFPITDFGEYDYIVVATVDKAVHDEEGYRHLKTFDLTIQKSLKGNLEIGNQISGKAKKEEPRAVCPVHLDEKSDYLLLMTKGANGYRLSRFSFPVKKSYKYFDDYISQIKKKLNEKEKN